jgi:hypothetical protein
MLLLSYFKVELGLVAVLVVSAARFLGASPDGNVLPGFCSSAALSRASKPAMSMLD